MKKIHQHLGILYLKHLYTIYYRNKDIFPKTVPFESSQVEKFMTAIYRFFKCVDINGQGAFVVNSGEAVWVFSTVLDRQEIQRWNDWKLREAKKTQQCPWNRYKNLVIRKRQK